MNLDVIWMTCEKDAAAAAAAVAWWHAHRELRDGLPHVFDDSDTNDYIKLQSYICVHTRWAKTVPPEIQNTM